MTSETSIVQKLAEGASMSVMKDKSVSAVTLLDLRRIEQEIDDLVTRKNENLEAIVRIKTQVEHAKADRSTGHAVDLHWLAQAKAALRHRGREDQEMAQELAGLKRFLRDSNVIYHDAKDDIFHRAFIRLVRDHLNERDFLAILQAAQREADRGQVSARPDSAP